MKSVIAVQFGRKLSGRTNYRKRLALLKSNTPRLIVRKTLTSIILQVANFEEIGDKVLLTVTSKKLKSLGWKNSCKNIPAAYLTGLLIGKMALAGSISKVTPDIGMQSVTNGGKIFAAIKGAKDAGLDIQIADSVLPSSEAISGAHIANYAKAAKHLQFSKNGAAAVTITKDFESVKAAIASGGWQSVAGEAKHDTKRKSCKS